MLKWYYQETNDQGESWEVFQACHSMSRQLKAQRTLTWVPDEYGSYFPSKNTSDALVDGYIRTFETVYRILHIPTFKRDYESLWERPSSMAGALVIKTQLCLAIGACLYDDTFSFRSHALQWIREAESWLDSSHGSQTAISSVQIMCLLVLALQNVQTSSSERTSSRCGALLRSAMVIDLHRDPAKLPPMSVAEAEIRRRLWTTILELVLDCSLDTGLPPLISLNDFDCALSRNFNDTDLNFNAKNDLNPRSEDELTDTTLQRILGDSVATRLSITQHANGIKDVDYEEVLRLHTEFTTAYRSLAASLQSLSPGVSQFQRQYCEMLMSRYVFSLHIPYIPSARENLMLHFSRAICVEAAVRLLHSSTTLLPTREPSLVAIQEMMVLMPRCDDHARLALCGNGPFRKTHFQAMMVVAEELCSLLGGSYNADLPSTTASTGHQMSDLRCVEMLSLLRSAAEWVKLRVKACQDNFGEFVFVLALLANVEAIRDGTSPEESVARSGKRAWLEAKQILTQLRDESLSLLDFDISRDHGLGMSTDFLTIPMSESEWEESLPFY